MNSTPLRFGHHALAVLGATMLGSTVFALIWTTGLAFAHDRTPGLAWLLTMASLFWLGVFIIALPVAAIVLSLLFPIVRRQTSAASWICLIAGATSGVVLAPLGSSQLHGATPLQLCVFSLTGISVAGFYWFIGLRLSGGRAIDVTRQMAA